MEIDLVLKFSQSSGGYVDDRRRDLHMYLGSKVQRRIPVRVENRWKGKSGTGPGIHGSEVGWKKLRVVVNYRHRGRGSSYSVPGVPDVSCVMTFSLRLGMWTFVTDTRVYYWVLLLLLLLLSKVNPS